MCIGQFTRWRPPDGNCDYIAEWDGSTWRALQDRDIGYYGFTQCGYCGKWSEYTDACPHCSAPTAKWWARLDRMIANQKGN
jgi:hypothetical protein